jgi:hypothetical protein
MKNENDFLLKQGAGGGSDPLVEYVLLGKHVSDGIFAWINFGVDLKRNRTISPATICSDTGCKQNEAKAKLGKGMQESYRKDFQGSCQKGLQGSCPRVFPRNLEGCSGGGPP